MLVFNNTNIINDTTVLTLRYGWTTWQDACDKQAFSAGHRIARVQPELHQRPVAEGRLPRSFASTTRRQDVGGWGAIPNRWKSPYSINGTLSKLMGSHSFKVGADMRRLGVATVSDTQMGGRFDFNSPLHEQQRRRRPRAGQRPARRCPPPGRSHSTMAPFEWFTKYYGAYVQDDWRVNERLTLNYGLRLEHEDGLREIENRQTVAFDQNVDQPARRAGAEDRAARRSDASRAA